MVELIREHLISDLLLQTLLVLFPVFLYQILMYKKNMLRFKILTNWKIVSLSCLSSIILCILFPVVIDGEYLFDFRVVPLILSFLYGGMISGIVTFILSGVLIIGFNETAMAISLLNISFVTILSLLYLRKFKESDRFKKISYFTALVSITSIIKVLSTMYMIMNQDININQFYMIFILFPIISVFVVWISIHLFENMIETILLDNKIQHAERLNVIGHLAASVAHEIRNPMTVIRGFMQIFSKESFIPDSKKQFLNLMIVELDRAEQIINDYLTLAKPNMNEADEIDLKDQLKFVKEIISSYAILNNVHINENLEIGLKLKGSKEKLNQVFINLLKNAIEASPNGGDISIVAYRTNSNIIVEISDYGIGLSSEALKRLGTPFYSTKEKGTGLGLMVSYGIVDAMGGKIVVKSEINKGTCFKIQFLS